MATLAERGIFLGGTSDDLVRELTRDEGLRLKPYRCTAGKLTIGVGRNLDDVGISQGEAEILLRNDIDRAAEGLDRELPWWRNLDEVRQRVMVNMTFNLGIQGLTGFKNTIELVRTGQYLDAAQHMMATKWAKQVGPRAERLALMMRDGKVA
jgi:lysozyme